MNPEKPVSKDHILYDCLCMRCLEQANGQRQKAD